MGRLDKKLAVITGAAQGIGAAIVRAFAAEGAQVIVTDINNKLGEQTANQQGAVYQPLDVSSEEDWRAFERLYPSIDVLVNNAGITGFEPGTKEPSPQDPEHASLDDWRRVHAVNSDGVFLGCRYAIGAMRQSKGGSIVNISSRSGLVDIPMAAAYAASKAAVRNHSKSVALYCAGQGLNIRCNSIHPGAVMTPMWEAMLGNRPDRKDREAAFVADTPLKRFGTVEEVANLALFLASDESSYITGAELSIDGGLLAGSAASPGS